MNGVEVNVFQGIVAFIEGLLVFKEGQAKKAATAAIIIALAGLVPSPAGGWNYNEDLWETIVATLVGAGVLSAVWDGGFGKNAMKVFILDTSSKTVANEIYKSIILVK